MGWAVGNIEQGGPLPVATGVESCELKKFGADVRRWCGVGIHGARGWGMGHTRGQGVDIREDARGWCGMGYSVKGHVTREGWGIHGTREWVGYTRCVRGLEYIQCTRGVEIGRAHV